MNAYKKLIVFYFSGTGNALRTAEWICKEAKETGLETQLVNIEKGTFDFASIDKQSLIGICSPTHGFNLPPLVIDFLFKIPSQKSVKAFLINTRGGTKLGRFFLPGLSGVAQIFPALVLWTKGISVVGYRPVDLPSNWISLHPGLRERDVEKIIEHWHKKVVVFTQRTLLGKKTYTGLYALPIDLLIAPISILYYFIGRFALAKTFVATDACTNCGFCVKNCPVNAIEERKSLFWSYRCESCMRCMCNCPERAIETAHGITFLLWWLVFGVLPAFLLSVLIKNELIGSADSPLSKLIEFAFVAVEMFLLFGAYSIMNYLMRFKWFNRLITYTSLTKLRFWNRYKFPAKLARNFTKKS